jgi:hypothetical protein
MPSDRAIRQHQHQQQPTPGGATSSHRAGASASHRFQSTPLQAVWVSRPTSSARSRSRSRLAALLPRCFATPLAATPQLKTSTTIQAASPVDPALARTSIGGRYKIQSHLAGRTGRTEHQKQHARQANTRSVTLTLPCRRRERPHADRSGDAAQESCQLAYGATLASATADTLGTNQARSAASFLLNRPECLGTPPRTTQIASYRETVTTERGETSSVSTCSGC